jgi:hypothetical protein
MAVHGLAARGQALRRRALRSSQLRRAGNSRVISRLSVRENDASLPATQDHASLRRESGDWKDSAQPFTKSSQQNVRRPPLNIRQSHFLIAKTKCQLRICASRFGCSVACDGQVPLVSTRCKQVRRQFSGSGFETAGDRLILVEFALRHSAVSLPTHLLKLLPICMLGS